jgi:hypothetical protein
MRRNRLRAAWGLALGVLFTGATAWADPPPYGAYAPGSPPPIAALPTVPPATLPATPAQVPIGAVPAAPNAGNTPADAGHGETGKADAGHGAEGGKADAGHGAEGGKAEAGHGSEGGHEGHEGHEEHDAWIVDFEYLLLHPVRGNTDYAVLGTNPNWGPIGVVQHADGGFDSGFRIGAGYKWSNGFDTVFRFTYFHANADHMVSGGNGIVVFPTMTFPAVVTQVNAAKGENSIDYNAYDLEFGRRWNTCDNVSLRWFVGPRVLELNQHQTGTYSGGQVAVDLVKRNVDWSGGGLRAGGEANYKFWEFMGVYLRGSASMMVGQFHSNLSENANGLPIVNVSETFTRVIPAVEMGVGVSFSKGSWRVTAGYEFINYFNMVNGMDFISDVHPGKLIEKAGDLGFHGLSFRATYLF